MTLESAAEPNIKIIPAMPGKVRLIPAVLERTRMAFIAAKEPSNKVTKIVRVNQESRP